MTDKQQIEEIQQILIECCNYVDENGNILGNKCYNCEHWDDTNNVCCSYESKQAEALYNAGCRKVEQDYAELLHEYECVSEGLVDAMELVHKIKAQRDVLKQQLAEARKETAKEIFTKLVEVAKNNDNKLSISLLQAWAIKYDMEVEE